MGFHFHSASRLASASFSLPFFCVHVIFFFKKNVESDPEGTDKVAVFIIASLIVSIILNLYLGK
jgi:hypothetical protein